MGFSFGSCVAGNLAGRLEAQGVGLARLFMIAPPVERFAVSLPARCPLTVVQPEDDDVVTPAAVYAWSESWHDRTSCCGWQKADISSMAS